MKKTVVALLLLVLMLMPNVASSRKEASSTKADVDKLQVLYLKAKFKNIRINLSKLREDLKSLSTSMTAHEALQSDLIKRAYEAIGGTEAICEYMESMTDRLSRVEKDKLSYYCYLQKYGVEQMKSRSNEYLHNIKRMRTQISNREAIQLVGKAEENIRSSSGLIDKVVETLQQCRGEEKPRLHH
jgi:molecular chaperone GrpE (heat shock protein)